MYKHHPVLKQAMQHTLSANEFKVCGLLPPRLKDKLLQDI